MSKFYRTVYLMELKIENEKLILDTSFTMKDYIETKVFLIEDLYKKLNFRT